MLEWCESLLAEGAYKDAEDFAKVLNEADEHPSRLMLARTLQANGKSKKAAKFLGAHIEKRMGAVDPEMFEVLQLQGKILAGMGKLKSAEENLEHALRALPLDKCFDKVRASTEYQLASLYAALGKLKKAQQIFNKSMPVNCDNSWQTNARIIDFFVDEELAKKASSSQVKLSDLEVLSEIKMEEKVKLIYLVSGDIFYCQKFGPSLAKSIAKIAGEDVHLHIHGVSVGKDDYGAKKRPWSKLIKDLNGQGLNVLFFKTAYK